MMMKCTICDESAESEVRGMAFCDKHWGDDLANNFRIGNGQIPVCKVHTDTEMYLDLGGSFELCELWKCPTCGNVFEVREGY